MDHFIDLARIGARNRAASSGEKQSARLAATVLRNAPGLDEEAIAGLHAFIDLTLQSPIAAQDLLR